MSHKSSHIIIDNQSQQRIDALPKKQAKALERLVEATDDVIDETLEEHEHSHE